MPSLVSIVITIVAVYVVYDLVSSYIAAVGTIWQKLLAAGKESATILWSRVVMVAAGGLDAAGWIADMVGQPGIAQAIQTNLSPNTVATIMVATAVIAEIARRRTLAKS